MTDEPDHAHAFAHQLHIHLSRKRGLNQARLAAGIKQPPAVITWMCQGKRLSGVQARARMLAIIGWLHNEGVLDSLDEANALLSAGKQPILDAGNLADRQLIRTIAASHATGAATPSVPQPVTSFIGRDQDRAQIAVLLRQARVITLTGPGGIGKTRLAGQVAAGAADAFPSGIVWIDLATLDNPDLVEPSVANALQPDGDQTPGYEQRLRNKRLLLVIDNCDLLIDATARLVERLSRTCPSIRLLITSREILNVEGEVIVRILPLAYPSPDHSAGDQALAEGQLRMATPDQAASTRRLGELFAYDAVRLFVERARVVRPQFQLTEQTAPHVLQICRRLEGIPLAIEMAAAALKFAQVEEIAERLTRHFDFLVSTQRLVPARHQTVEATIAWSYRLLPEPERRLFQRLSVFAGGWMLDDALAVCDVDAPIPHTLAEVATSPILARSLSALVDKSMVMVEATHGQSRYRLLETVRDYAAGRLEAAGELEQLQRRHFAWFRNLAAYAAPALQRSGQTRWFQRLAAEQDNLRAALHWAQRHDADGGLHLAVALAGFWRASGELSEARMWLATLIASAENAPADLRVQALSAAGELAAHQADLVQAEICFQQALDLERGSGNPVTTIPLLTQLGMVAHQQGSINQALRLFDECLLLAKQTNDHQSLAATLVHLGTIAFSRGDYSTARTLTEERLALVRQLGDTHGMAEALRMLGNILAVCGDEAAVAYDEESLALYRSLNDPENCALGYRQLGNHARKQGNPHLAQESYAASMALYEELGNKQAIAYVLADQGDLAAEQGDLARAARKYNASLSIQRELQNKWGQIGALIRLGDVAVRRKKYAAAQTYYQQSKIIGVEVGDHEAIATALGKLGSLAAKRGNLQVAQTQFKESLTLYYRLQNKLGIAKSLIALAQLELAEEHLDEVARLCAGAGRLCSMMGVQNPETIDPTYTDLIAALRQRSNYAIVQPAGDSGQHQDITELIGGILAEE